MPYADARGGRIYYETYGDGEPLLMIPGFGATTLVYSENIPALAEHFRVIVFDPRGAGRSDTPEGASMQMYVDDCVTMMEVARAAETHVLGASWGGMVAQNLALAYPERVRGLILACTTPGGPHHVSPPPENMARFLAASDIPDPAEAVRSLYPLHYSDRYAAENDASIVARALAGADLRSRPEGRLRQLTAVQEHDTHDRLHEIAAPTLVAHGEDDGVVPVDNARKLAARIPNATLDLYPEARHVFFIERAEEFNCRAVDFLRSA